MSEHASVLRSAKVLITNPAHWIQGNFAQNARGKVVASSSKAAVCWDLSGAVFCAALHAGVRVHDVIAFVHQITGGGPVAFNDAATHKEVLIVLDRAIALAEAA
jgi:hypothetical protein